MKSFSILISNAQLLFTCCIIGHFHSTTSGQAHSNENITRIKYYSERELEALEDNQQGSSRSGRNREGRCFSPFVVIRVKDDACTSKESDVVGTCMTWKNCLIHKGNLNGICALGFGICCTFKRTCGAQIIHNNTYFQSRDFPAGSQSNGVETCTVDILKRSKNICQVRLDFLSTNIEGGNNNGVCQIDRIQFSGIPDGVGTIPPNLCGSMDGQSMYLDYGQSNKISLSFITDGNLSSKLRSWNVRIRYIPCNTVYTAPNGCFQYFTGTVGQVKILGYPQSPHLGDLAYAVCVRAEEGARSISWSRCSQEPIDQSFWFTGSPFSTGASASTNCNGDYVVIMSTLIPGRLSDRYCGNTLVATSPIDSVTSAEKPFILRVKTDAIESTVEEANTGFCLQWRQNFL